jgi:hypothetical protein
MSDLPTWREIADSTLDALNQSQRGLSEARDWMKSDWRDGKGPANPAKKQEAERLIREAKAAIDRAKTALYESAGR